MSYLLIIFILLLIAAPLVWMKPSARQQQIAVFRQAASHSGILVKLCYPPDARKGEGRLDHAKYIYAPSKSDNASDSCKETWFLVKNTKRGDQSPWEGWNWLEGRATHVNHAAIAQCLDDLSEDVDGLSADKDGIGFYWQERGDKKHVDKNIQAIKTLFSMLKP